MLDRFERKHLLASPPLRPHTHTQTSRHGRPLLEGDTQPIYGPIVPSTVTLDQIENQVQ